MIFGTQFVFYDARDSTLSFELNIIKKPVGREYFISAVKERLYNGNNRELSLENR